MPGCKRTLFGGEDKRAVDYYQLIGIVSEPSSTEAKLLRVPEK